MEDRIKLTNHVDFNSTPKSSGGSKHTSAARADFLSQSATSCFGANCENVAPNIATTLASTLDEPVPGWKGHFGPGGPGGGPPPLDNPAFSTPPGPSTPTGPGGGGMPPGPGTPGFTGNFHGPSPGPPMTPSRPKPALNPSPPIHSKKQLSLPPARAAQEEQESNQ